MEDNNTKTDKVTNKKEISPSTQGVPSHGSAHSMGTNKGSGGVTGGSYGATTGPTGGSIGGTKNPMKGN